MSAGKFLCKECGADISNAADADPDLVMLDTGEVKVSFACAECDCEHVAYVPFEEFSPEEE